MTQCYQYQQKIKPGISFYKFLLNDQALKRIGLKINFPNTMIMDNQGFYKLVYTDQDGYVKNKILEKDQYFTVMKKDAQKFSQKLKIHYGKKIYKQCDYTQNQNAPVLIIKSSDDQEINFQTQVQTYRTFIEKKPKPTRNKFLQRYIYGRNMKSMIFRHCYQRCEIGQQRQQVFGYRFQNIQPIFRKNPKTDAFQIHKLTSTIQLSIKRMNSIQYSKITNKNGLHKYSQQLYSLKSFIQKYFHIKIQKLYIDFIVDLFDVPWVINIKYLQSQRNQDLNSLISLQQYARTIGTCKLCNNIYAKQQVKKVLSTRMIHQFLQHLQKRIKVSQLHKVKFIKQVNINLKQHKTCHACECCYNMVMQQLQLRNCEKQLAKICNIFPKDQFVLNSIVERPAQLQNQLKQWRLMIYMVQIRNLDLKTLTSTSYGSGKISQMTNNTNNQYDYRGLNKNGNINHKNKNLHRNTRNLEVSQNSYHRKISAQNFGNRNNSGFHFKHSRNISIQNALPLSSLPISPVRTPTPFSPLSNHNRSSSGFQSYYKKFSAHQQKQNQNLYFHYKLGTGVQQSWKIKSNQNNSSCDSDTLLINKLKIHYFYTPADCIDKFLKNTEIGISLSKGDDQNPIVNGSTGILSHFKNRFPQQCGQRQTSTVLLFFQNGKYCQLTLKVGLVCDGIYNTSDMNLYRQNHVYFPDKNFINSNTFPKQWMQIFTQNYQLQSQEKTYEDIYQSKIASKNTSCSGIKYNSNQKIHKRLKKKALL